MDLSVIFIFLIIFSGLVHIVLFYKKHKNFSFRSSISRIFKKSKAPSEKEILGRSTWKLLHSMADNIETQTDINALEEIIYILSENYPCKECQLHMQDYLMKNELDCHTKEEMREWLSNFHNAVNIRLGKRIVPYLPLTDNKKCNECINTL